ncbi:MAG: hypothetical protein OEO77_08595 [Acidimicrobiia bacterium]|nr:hypothetical protein [Acidimicrobiia bacterium]
MPWIWTDDLARLLAPSTVVPDGVMAAWTDRPIAFYLAEGSLPASADEAEDDGEPHLVAA